MDFGVFGDLGSGKTLFAVFLARLGLLTGWRVKANFHIDGAEILEVTDLIDLDAVPDNTLLVVDEIYSLAESRVSSSKINRYFSYVNFQSRKLGRHIIYTAQLSSAVDLRFTELTHLPIKALSRVGLPEGSPFRYLFYVGDREIPFQISYEFAKDKLFGFYDTSEVVRPFGLSDLVAELERDSPVRFNSRVDGIVDFLCGKYRFKFVDSHVVNDLMVRHGFPLSMGKFVLARIKSRGKYADVRSDTK